MFASQVDVNNDLSKPVTTHYLPKKRESAVVKPLHVIASSESRNSSKNMPRFSSNDKVHNHYLEEAKKKTQGSGRNSRPSENKTLKRHYKELYDSIKITRATKEHTTSLIAQNAEFKAQQQERGFAIAALKNELRKLTGNNVNMKFAKSSILRKPVLQPHRNQSVVRQPTAFKSERPRISKPMFASQVDVNNDLSKPVTTHYLPKKRESAVVKPLHVIASSESRNSSKNMPRFSSNDKVHNHYLEEAKKKTQGSGRNSRPSVMPFARSQCTTNGSKPKPRSNNQNFSNWPASKSSCVMTKTVPIAEHPRNSRNFFDSKHFVCSTCQKCVFNAKITTLTFRRKDNNSKLES
nr:hypothetical protein [Tanacetum cinerariifolium]